MNNCHLDGTKFIIKQFIIFIDFQFIISTYYYNIIIIVSTL